jgi:hypothetical protein
MSRGAVWKWLTRLAVSGLAVGALFTPAAQASNGNDEAAVAGVRQATAAFHDLDKAEHAQYGRLLECFDLPGVGGMGQHYADTTRFDATIEPNRPEALVYEVDGNRLQLVAVEYIVPWTSWVASDPPRLFGHDFTSVTSLHIWALHAWIWRPNPLGMFQNYNPRVKLCPGH